MMKISLMKAQIEVYGSLPGVTQALVKNALTDKGVRDRRLLFQISGILPTVHAPGPFAVTRNTRTLRTEAQPETPPAESPGVLNQPWRRTPPGKLG
jgi:hypothetical protein